MSKVDQAKKEAKRLFGLAKNNENSIRIENLSQAKEIISLINGYKHWYEYEINLKKQDIRFFKTDKKTKKKEENNVLENINYFKQKIDFNVVPSEERIPVVLKEIKHTPIILATKKKRFAKDESQWILDQYPLLISGSAGSGKSECLLSLMGQYIKNKEGVIYFDGKGDNCNYAKFFSYCKEYNRLNDYYILNFLSKGSSDNKSVSHTIDPINPMVGCLEYFKYFFGDFGNIINEILISSHLDKKLLTIEGLESTLMLDNLIDWDANNKFKTTLIKEYLLSLGINKKSDISSLILEKHSKNLSIAYDTIQVFKRYSHIFKVKGENYFKEGYKGHVDMKEIFAERKILLVMLPFLEKSSRQNSKITDLIMYQVKFIESVFKDVDYHFQNIVINDSKHVFKDFFKKDLYNTNNNYIFSINEIDSDSDLEQFLLHSCKTKFILRNEISDISTNLKLEIINNIKELPTFKDYGNIPFIKGLVKELRNQDLGQGYIICKNKKIKKNNYVINNEERFYFEKIIAYYNPAKDINNFYLINHNY